MASIRINVKDYITANGPSVEALLVGDSVLKGYNTVRVEATINRMTKNGKLIKTGDDYSLPV